jgi:hypothetical protein
VVDPCFEVKSLLSATPNPSFLHTIDAVRVVALHNRTRNAEMMNRNRANRATGVLELHNLLATILGTEDKEKFVLIFYALSTPMIGDKSII